MSLKEDLTVKLTSALKSIPNGYHNPDIVGECVDLIVELIEERLTEPEIVDVPEVDPMTISGGYERIDGHDKVDESLTDNFHDDHDK